MADIHFQSVRKNYGKTTVIKDVSLEIKDGEFMVLLGPSGCGKTTLLRCLAGLEHLNAGHVFIGERDVTDLAPRDRKIAMVFQSYAVFPHLTVFANIAFGLQMQNRPKEEIKRRVNQSAELLELTDYLTRYPAQLSGGQRQRVAVARAIVMEAAVLLMDEPLSNLDALLRMQMRAELKRLHDEIKATTIYVTHDQIEALSLGDRIAVMHSGNIVQCDAPMNIYDYPANAFIGGFIGTPPMNFLKGAVRSEGGAPIVTVGEAHISPTAKLASTLAAKSGQAILLGIRPENLALVAAQQPNTIRAHVLVVEPLGSHKLLTMRIGAELAKVSVAPDQPVAPNDDVWLHFDADKIRWMDATSRQALGGAHADVAP